MPVFPLNKLHFVNYFLMALILVTALLLVRNVINISFSREKPHLIATGDKTSDNTTVKKKNIMHYSAVLEKNPFGSPMKFHPIAAARTGGAARSADSRGDITSDLILVGTVVGPKNLSYAIFEDKSQSTPYRQEIFTYEENVYTYGILTKIETALVELKHGSNTYTIPLVEIQAQKTRVKNRANKTNSQSSFVKKIGKRQYLLDQRKVQQALKNPEQILTDARLLPHFQNGKQEGFKISEVKPGGLYKSLGLKNGDILLRINELEISNPEVAIQAMSALRGMNKVNLDIIRDGAKLTMSYQIK